jgi:cell wall-associated NlpC family hydrolase
MEGYIIVLKTKKLFRKVISVGICAAIGFTGLGLSQFGTAEAATPKTNKIIKTGAKYLGVKYRFGAPSGVTYAFDCSSFTQYIFKKNGIYLPRTSRAQAAKGIRVAKSHLSKGDLVFFKSPGRSGIGHVAVYAGYGRILHAAGKSVKFSTLNSTYWKTHYVTARRVVKNYA